MDADEDIKGDPNERRTDRRTFMKGVAAAGVLSATAIAPPLAGQTATQPSQADRGRGQFGGGLGVGKRQPRKPSLDLRNPESYAGIADATRVLMDHFKALSQRDMKGVADTLHFPYATVEQTDVVVVDTQDELMTRAPASINMTDNPERFTDHDGYVQPGSYDVFGGIEVFNSDPVQVNLALTYDRYSSQGNKLLRCEGVYCVTNNDGRWAIQLMSTIFTPGPMVFMEFPGSVATAHRIRETHTNGFQRAWAPDVWANTRQYGLNVGVNAAKDNDYGFSKAPPFKNGIKNRLQVTNYTAEKLEAIKIDFKATRDRWKDLGMGNWGFDWGGGPPARLIHQTVNKVHYYQGTTRFTATGEYISNTEEIDVITLREGRWGWAAILGYIINHDRANDIKSIRL
ncbi:MAG: twin-arginine translocation signal domain-containing protein [Candidatus Acidiferrales bacterium]